MGEVLHYRDFRKPAERWGNTERRASDPIPDTGPCETIPFGGFVFDPGPYVSPYIAPENDSA